MKQESVGLPTFHEEVNKKIRSIQDNWIEERSYATEKGMKAGNSKEAYDTLHDLTKTN